MVLNKLKDNELSEIIGGNKWGSAITGGLSGAASGVKYCKSVGPWAMVGCGIAGAVIGGYIGYR